MRTTAFTLIISIASIFAVSYILIQAGLHEKASTIAPVKVVENMNYEPISIYPNNTQSHQDIILTSKLFTGLVRLDNDGAIKPGMASEWKISDDGKTYTFTIRPDAKWSDGTKVIPYDFVLSMRELVNPSNNAVYKSFPFIVKNAKAITEGKLPLNTLGIKATENDRLQIQLEARFDDFLYMLTSAPMMPVPSHIQDREVHYVSNGPFQVQEWERGIKIVLRKNPLYFDKDAVRVDKVSIPFLSDGMLVYKGFQSGKIDIARGDMPVSYHNLEKGGNFHISNPSGVDMYIVHSSIAAKYPHIVDAISLAMDREAIADKLYQGQAEPAARSLVPYGMLSYNTSHDNSEEIYNLEKAKSLMHEMGFSKSRLLTLTLTTESNKMSAREFNMQSKVLSQIFIELKHKPVKAYQKNLDILNKDFEYIKVRWNYNYKNPIDFLINFTYNSKLNYVDYRNPDFNDLIVNAINSPDSAQSVQLLMDAESFFLKTAPIVPIAFYRDYALVSARVKGFTIRGYNASTPIELISIS